MRTEILKKGLPIGAFMLAIAFAFATEKKEIEPSVLETGEILLNGVCTPNSKECDNIPLVVCRTTSSQTVFKAGTNCMQPLFHSVAN